MRMQLFHYLLESSICLAIFYLFFRLFLQKETFFRINRTFVLTALFLSLLIPVIEIPLQEESTVIQQVFLLQAIPVTQAQQSENIPVGNILLGSYAAISSFLLLRLIYQIGKLLHFSRKCRSSKMAAYQLVLTEGKLPTFSFFRLLFWDNTQTLSEENKMQILKHELTHIRQWHSLDMIFVELIKVFFWFHPAVYLLKKALQQVHEYLADAAVAKQHNRETYVQLLVSQVLSSMNLSFTNPFNQSPTKNRIIMLQKANLGKPAFWKIALSLPVIFTLIFIYSCKTNDSVEPQAKVSRSKSDPDEVLDKYKSQYPGIKLESVNVLKKDNVSSVEVTVAGVDNVEDKRKIEQEINQVLTKSKATYENADSNLSSKSQSEIFTVVEQQPEFEGGIEALYKYIGENLRYPAEAVSKKIEGRVFVSFVVNQDGSVSDVDIMKGIGNGCDEVARTVVLNSPKWKPGMQSGKPVRVRFSLPIEFKL